MEKKIVFILLGISLGLATTLVSIPTAQAAGSSNLELETLDGAPDPVGQGQRLRYHVTISNFGPTAAANARLEFLMPPGVNFASVDQTHTNGVSNWTCGESGGTVQCAAPSDIPANFGISNFWINVDIPVSMALGPISATARAITSDVDPVAANNERMETTTVKPGAGLVVALESNPESFVNTGFQSSGTNNFGQVFYTFTVTNLSSVAITGITTTHELSRGAIFQTGGAACSKSGSTITCGHPSLGPGNSFTHNIFITTSPAVSRTCNKVTAQGSGSTSNSIERCLTVRDNTNIPNDQGMQLVVFPSQVPADGSSRATVTAHFLGCGRQGCKVNFYTHSGSFQGICTGNQSCSVSFSSNVVTGESITAFIPISDFRPASTNVSFIGICSVGTATVQKTITAASDDNPAGSTIPIQKNTELKRDRQGTFRFTGLSDIPRGSRLQAATFSGSTGAGGCVDATIVGTGVKFGQSLIMGWVFTDSTFRCAQCRCSNRGGGRQSADVFSQLQGAVNRGDDSVSFRLAGKELFKRIGGFDPVTFVSTFFNMEAFEAGAGNPAQLTVTYCADLIAPTVTDFRVNGAATPTIVTTNSPVTITWTATDSAGAELWRAPDAGGNPGAWSMINASTSSGDKDTPAEGIWWYRIHVFDGAGNCITEAGGHCGGVASDGLDPRANRGPIQVIMDTTPPSVSITSPAAGSSYADDFAVKYTAIDTNIKGCRLSTKDGGASWDDQGTITCGSAQTTTIDISKWCTTGGANQCGVKIWADDTAGNTNEKERFFSINKAPVVDAGPDQTVPFGFIPINLDATVTDDGFPIPPGAVAITWTRISGPGTEKFEDVTAVDTTVIFSQAGTHVLRLTANDSEKSAFHEITILYEGPDPGPLGGTGYSLIPCGVIIDDPDTPFWDETDDCELKHTFLLIKNLIDFSLWKLAPLIIVLLTIATGVIFYFSLGSADTLAKVRLIWSSVLKGVLILLFSWLFLNFLLGILGFDITIFGRWYEIEI